MRFERIIRLGKPWESILPLCDEFVINLGDSEDQTNQLVADLQASYPNMRWIILHSKWDLTQRKGGLILSEQTNIALRACTGDWCFYIQADEVIHERDLKTIEEAITQNHSNPNINGLKLYWKHMAASLCTFEAKSGCYNQEIRIIRRSAGIESWGDAQSFRMQLNQAPIECATIQADVYHYSHARAPEKMLNKIQIVGTWWHTDQEIEQKKKEWKQKDQHPITNLIVDDEAPPAVMQNFICEATWSLRPMDFLVPDVQTMCVILTESDYQNRQNFTQLLESAYPNTQITYLSELSKQGAPEVDLGVDLAGSYRSYFKLKRKSRILAGWYDSSQWIRRYDILINTKNRNKKNPSRPLNPYQHLARAAARLGAISYNRYYE